MTKIRVLVVDDSAVFRRTMAEELSTNPFLRAGEVSVRAAVEQHAGRALRDRVGVFAELRAWKNSF